MRTRDRQIVFLVLVIIALCASLFLLVWQFVSVNNASKALEDAKTTWSEMDPDNKANELLSVIDYNRTRLDALNAELAQKESAIDADEQALAEKKQQIDAVDAEIRALLAESGMDGVYEEFEKYTKAYDDLCKKYNAFVSGGEEQ